MNLRALFQQMRGMKHYFVAAVLVFGTGIFLGYGYADSFGAFLDAQLGQLGSKFQGIMSSPHRQLWLFLIIFLNNTLLSILIMYAGVLFAILPIYFLITNGMIIGYLASGLSGANHWLLFLKAVLPHGVLEIPAILIASAYGIRFGFLSLDTLLKMPFAKGRELARIKFITLIKATVPLMLVLSVTLLAAAGIESTVSLWLSGK